MFEALRKMDKKMDRLVIGCDGAGCPSDMTLYDMENWLERNFQVEHDEDKEMGYETHLFAQTTKGRVTFIFCHVEGKENVYIARYRNTFKASDSEAFKDFVDAINIPKKTTIGDRFVFNKGHELTFNVENHDELKAMIHKLDGCFTAKSATDNILLHSAHHFRKIRFDAHKTTFTFVHDKYDSQHEIYVEGVGLREHNGEKLNSEDFVSLVDALVATHLHTPPPTGTCMTRTVSYDSEDEYCSRWVRPSK